jgi:hypothetical protein
LSRGGGLRTGFAALDLGAPASVFEGSGRFFFGRFTDLDMVGHCHRPRAFGQPRGPALVLNDVSLAFACGYATFEVHLEFLDPDRRFGKPGANFLLDFGV